MRFQRMAAWAGIAGPVLFVATFLVQDGVRPSFDPLSQVVSELTAGPAGWVQQVNFVVLGLSTIAFAIGLHRGIAPSRLGVSGPAILAVNGVAAVLAGAAFPLRADAMGNVYDPGGHQVVGTAFFATAAIACLCLAPRLARDPRWNGMAPLALTTGVVGVACFVLMGTLVIPDAAPLQSWAGLAQRAIVILVLFPLRIVLGARLLALATSPARQVGWSRLAA